MFWNKLFGRKNETDSTVENIDKALSPKVNSEAIQNELQSIVPNHMEINSDGVLEKYTGQDEVVTVPEGVRNIGYNAFQSNQFIKEVILPESLVEIEAGAFKSSSLEKIIIPSNVKKIGNSVFYGCKQLHSVVLPDELEYIEYDTFTSCISLTHLTLPSKLKMVGKGLYDGAFSGSGIIELHIPDSMTYIGEYSFQHMYCLERLYLPSTLKGIGENAFGQCDNLKEIELPEGLTMIERCAFDSCSKLEKVVFSRSLVVVDRKAFEGTEIQDSEELQEVYARLDAMKVYQKLGGYKELTLDGLTFYYREEKVDYEAMHNKGPNQFENYDFEHDRDVTDSWRIFRNKAGKKALVIRVSVPTFDFGDREWDSYRKLFLIPEEDGMNGFLVCGGYRIAKVLAYEDVHYADEKTERLLQPIVKEL